MIIEEEVYLAHYGKKGMKWGERRDAKRQEHRDRLTRLATGTANRQDKIKVYNKFGITGSRQAERQIKLYDKQTKRIEKRRAFYKRNKKNIAIGSTVVAGAVATGIILKAVSNKKVKDLRKTHEGFVSVKESLDKKMTTRMSTLKDLAKQTPKGHPSHEGAMKEIKNLNEFYKTKVSALTERHGVTVTDLKKMKLKSAL